jgi:hypothetical protein
MRNEGQNILVVEDDGFGDESESGRLLQGGRLACVDGKWTYAKDDTEVPADKRFLALGTAEGQQLWQNEQLIEESKKKPGVPFGKSVDERNAEIPKDTWEEGLNGPREPWTHVFAVYLIDPADGAIYTSINSTKGQARAVRELKSKVKWMRSLRNGAKLMPVVVLGRQLISKQYKKLGPDFVVVDWRDLGPALPAEGTPLLEKPADQKEPVEQIGRPRAPVNVQEAMQDELPPWDKNDGPNDPISDILDAPTQPSPAEITAEKPKPASKPEITKSGAQKIAASRGR